MLDAPPPPYPADPAPSIQITLTVKNESPQPSRASINRQNLERLRSAMTSIHTTQQQLMGVMADLQTHIQKMEPMLSEVCEATAEPLPSIHIDSSSTNLRTPPIVVLEPSGTTQTLTPESAPKDASLSADHDQDNFDSICLMLESLLSSAKTAVEAPVPDIHDDSHDDSHDSHDEDKPEDIFWDVSEEYLPGAADAPENSSERIDSLVDEVLESISTVHQTYLEHHPVAPSRPDSVPDTPKVRRSRSSTILVWPADAADARLSPSRSPSVGSSPASSQKRYPFRNLAASPRNSPRRKTLIQNLFDRPASPTEHSDPHDQSDSLPAPQLDDSGLSSSALRSFGLSSSDSGVALSDLSPSQASRPAFSPRSPATSTASGPSPDTPYFPCTEQVGAGVGLGVGLAGGIAFAADPDPVLDDQEPTLRCEGDELLEHENGYEIELGRGDFGRLVLDRYSARDSIMLLWEIHISLLMILVTGCWASIYLSFVHGIYADTKTWPWWGRPSDKKALEEPALHMPGSWDAGPAGALTVILEDVDD
ncbi:uncharacterized protein BJ171DRAFT_520379 [Polychytrium aggregatum]|uniref:uncharacterized protein n=1 Tax=Polychytrium aggregatum TaxID=110093 RepID=UPI0022FDD794|nr:uncharacterized protein BJ171DRAFT_520379 [Polychytrium aggregatum]KAI9197253.1 hypothetical protein BJ171DRAFT_520379 [Polychytrium aggregatum]